MGTCWGVGKVMAEIQALLYLSPRPLSLEDMSHRLKISRSNISVNVRGLQDLGVVKKVIVPGDRKDYYTAEEDVARVARRLAGEKKRRELDPALSIVRDAIRAADQAGGAAAVDAGPDRLAAVDTQRLHKLRQLMEIIEDIFDSFIGEAPSDSRPDQPLKTSRS